MGRVEGSDGAESAGLWVTGRVMRFLTEMQVIEEVSLKEGKFYFHLRYTLVKF